MKKFKSALIGCGAIAERIYIPAAIKLPEIDLVALVDLDRKRAKALAERFGIKKICQNFRDILDTIDIAIVATPNASHAEISRECLKQGIHVLCEKPMATSVQECKSMISASESGNSKLMIGHYMRYTSNARIARQFISDKAIRNIHSIKCSSGHIFHWPSVSHFYDSYELSGGGVLIDWGVHIFDLICWLTNQDVKVLNYRVRDPIISEVERDVEIDLQVGNGTKCELTLSRTRKLANTLEIKGENGWIKIYLDNYQELEIYKQKNRSADDYRPISIIGERCDPYIAQMQDLVTSIKDGASPSISGFDGLRTIELVKACYDSQVI